MERTAAAVYFTYGRASRVRRGGRSRALRYPAMASEDHEHVALHTTRAEMMLISNALNEVCNGVHIDDFEFQTRLGVSREEARRLLRQIHERLREMAG